MDERTNFNDHVPIYNIKAVSRLVGLLPVTLRAWERRYGLPQPGRGEQGYRLYSEYDVRTLRWLKAQNESGLSIGRAVDYLNELRTTGYDPASDTVYQPTQAADRSTAVSASSSSPSLHNLYEEFLNALVHFEERQALEIMRRAFAIYAVDQVLTQVVEPTLVTLGEAWHRGELPIAVEHYATQFCMQHLMSMLAAAAPPSRDGIIVAACAPGELHQVGVLMLVVMLRWRGWDVKYLGPDLSLDRLEEALVPLRPQIIMFSANRIETAERLLELPEIVARFPPPQPLILLGGQAFRLAHLPEHVAAVYIEGSPVETVEKIERMMMRLNGSSPLLPRKL
jgi:MerR family transcriptional regulator, light-induced transcriptional regulator